jgi:hypothetical protein
MQYAEHLPNPRRMVVPVVALVVGAAAATGTWALLDSEQVALQPPKVIVTEAPAQPSQGVAAKNEAATAAAIGTGAVSNSFGKDEAATAAAIGTGTSSSSFGKDEAASAAAIGTGASGFGRAGVNAKDEAATAAAVGSGIELRGSKASSSGSSGNSSKEIDTADPHGPASALP